MARPTPDARLARLDEAQLPAAGDVLVRINYSTISYKDGLAINGKAPVVRTWPMVPGIDGAGERIASSHPHWKISLAEALVRAPDILAGKVRGRLVVNVNA